MLLLCKEVIRLKNIIKRVVCISLSLITVIGSVLLSTDTAYADSNDRISAYIRLAANESVTDEDIGGMTESQLRFLGLYLSNFYIPFGTEIGTSAGELADTTKADMVATLQQKFAFSEEMSTSIVETVFGYTRSSLSKLQIYTSKGYQDGSYVKVENLAPNYYNFLRLMLGRSDDVFSRYFKNCNGKTKEVDIKNEIANNIYGKKYDELSSHEKEVCNVYYKIENKNYKYIYFAYEKGGDITPAFDCKIGDVYFKDKTTKGDSNYTASQVAFLKCLESSNLEKGYGFNILDFAKSDEATDDVLAELGDSATESEYTEMTVFGADMAIDCFGDIISVGGNHQVVVVPGCMNPYSWQSVKSDGSNGNVKAGSVYNMANAISMTQADIASNSSSCANEFIKSVSKSVNTTQSYLPTVDPNTGLQYNGVLSGVIDGSNVAGSALNSGFIGPMPLPEQDDVSLTFKPNFEVLNKNLDNIKQHWSIWDTADEDYALTALRLQRGSTDYQFNTGFLGFGSDESRSFLKKAIDGFKESNPNDKSYFYSSRSGGEVSENFWDKTAAFDCAVPRTRYSDDMYYGVQVDTPIKLFSNVVLIDNLGVYKDDSGVSPAYSTFNVCSYIDESTGKTGSEDNISFGEFSFGNLFKDIKTGKMSVPYDASETALCTLYVTYCWAGLYDESSKADTIGKLGYKINTDGLPTMSNSPISLGGITAVDHQLNAIKDWTYYLLHPTDGYDYVRILVTNKVNHLLLGWHNDIVGTNEVGVTTGTTKYRSNMSYVTMPDLSEIKWTDSLIGFYNDCIPFLIIALIIIMIFAYITGIMDLQHAIIGVLLFSIFTLMPVNLINATVEQSNRISQNIYGDKFTYWALVQQESYAQAIDEAANATGSSGTSSYENYLRTLYAENQAVYTNQGGESILLKWQAPKKMASLVLTESDSKSLNGLGNAGQQMLSGMLNNTYDGQSYTEDEDAVYMYRSYLDISNFSRYIYKGIKEGTVKSKSVFNGVSMDNWKCFKDSRGRMIKSVADITSEYKDYINDGYLDGTSFGTKNNLSDQFYLTVPMSSDIIDDTLSIYDKINTFDDSKDMIPINTDVFNFGIPMFTNDSVRFDANTMAATGFITDSDRKQELSNYMSKYDEEDFVGLAAYGIYSENPYYYFSWKLYADGLDVDSSLSSNAGFKNLILGKEDGGFFYNSTGNGGLKDFMNMRGMFHYIIPYMKQCNDVVREWDETFGIFVYEGVPTEEGHWSEVSGDPELEAKYWHNLNVSRLYCIYCPWVDVMYDCSYAEAETIKVMGRKEVIDDPLNPNCYPDDRPMIFSESEMSDYGLTEADLTKVEKLILKCNEGYQERLYELLNYYNFSDVTLNSAAAMNCAFVFNSTFSENGLFADNHNIYPQSFDLANFSYDAYLRLILANATGEDLLNAEEVYDTESGKTTGDFYERIVNNSSTVTIIVMLILDVLSVYLIPAFRIFFLIAIFIAIIMIVLVSALKIEDNAKFIRKVATQFLLPLFLFFTATVGFSWLISLFMGTGNNSVTQSNRVEISMGDPVITMFIMIVLDIILLIVYWKIIKKCLQDMKHQAKLLGGFATSLGGAVVGFAAGAVAGGVNTAQSVGSAVRRHRMNKFLKKGNETLDNMSNNPAQEGTGVENGRANSRGSSNASSTAEEEVRNPRDLDKDKREARGKDVDYPDESEAKREAIDKKANSSSRELEAKFAKENYDRHMKEQQTIDRDFGYAKDDKGFVDTSKLSAKDKYKYNDRMKRISNNDRKVKSEQFKAVSSARENSGKHTKKGSSSPRAKVDVKPKNKK